MELEEPTGEVLAVVAEVPAVVESEEHGGPPVSLCTGPSGGGTGGGTTAILHGICTLLNLCQRDPSLTA